MDKITPEKRSKNMSRIKSKDTAPELIIRKLLFSKGYRYMLHYYLKGKPDIVFPKYKIAIFIHGCFWHGHGCKVDHISKSNAEYWNKKIKTNKVRDASVQNILKHENWKVFTLWECKILEDSSKAIRPIIKYLSSF